MAPTNPWLAGWRPYALLAALCLCLYLPGIAAIPVLDRDEARFAQSTRQMLQTGDFLHIRFRDEARNNKPAGIYWLQAASVAALSTPGSTAIWPYRVPSLVGAALAALLTFAFARVLTGDPGTALAAGVMLAAALGTVTEAHIAKTDAALLAATVLGQGALGLAYARARAGSRAGFGNAAAFWLAEIVAIYLKGPIAPGIAVLTAATLSIADRDARWLRSLRPLAGIAVTVLAVAPWLYAIEHATEGQFLDQSVGHDFWAKVMGGQEAHGAPPLYYLALSLLTFWPGSLLIAPAVIAGWRRRAEPACRFLLAWLIPAWVALELVPTKLPHYALPLYPALAMLAALALAGGIGEGRWARWIALANRLLWALATLAIAAALIVLPLRLGHGLDMAAILGAIAAIILLIAMLWRRAAISGVTALVAAMALVFAIPALGFVVPGLDRVWLSRAAAGLVAAHPPDPAKRLFVMGYTEPSLVFLLEGDFASGIPGTYPVAVGEEALVTNAQDAAFHADLTAHGLAASQVGAVAGVDYSNGERMVLTLYRIEAK